MDAIASKENTPLSPSAGQKRPAALLPAFEPLSSSPSLPRPAKRFASDAFNEASSYPTPVPTSSTAILPSSPPKYQSTTRQLFNRAQSTFSERAPLSAVPTINLDANGETILMGRSSASCHYQLSSSRLISRVHVEATFKSASSPLRRDRVEILCSGWNGIKIHCQGKTYDLKKGKTFACDIRDADIIIDVQDVRVLVRWPEADKKELGSGNSDAWEEEGSPTRNRGSARRRSAYMSPLQERPRLDTPVSPSPAVRAAALPSSPFLPANVSSQVEVYEDEPSPTRSKVPEDATFIDQTSPHASQSVSRDLKESFVGSLTESHEFSDDPDEENDPIVHSFGPFGHNILPRMQAFTAGGGSPHVSPRASSTKASTPTPRPRSTKVYDQPEHEDVRNHVVNQLAFSRLSSTPLSTIVNNLPADLKPTKSSDGNGVSREDVKNIIDSTACIGKVERAGKDAAGQPLESEYYYVPEFDSDVQRKETVVNDLRKPSLRACRKQHKQYYWRKPK